MSIHLEERLGRCMSARDVAEYLHCDITTVYRNYAQLGGIKFGSNYRFFEQRLIDAVLQQTTEQVDSTGCLLQEKVQKLPRKQNSSQAMGSRKKSRIERSGGSRPFDPHALLA
jgi:hypothetical protein